LFLLFSTDDHNDAASSKHRIEWSTVAVGPTFLNIRWCAATIASTASDMGEEIGPQHGSESLTFFSTVNQV